MTLLQKAMIENPNLAPCVLLLEHCPFEFLDKADFPDRCTSYPEPCPEGPLPCYACWNREVPE